VKLQRKLDEGFALRKRLPDLMVDVTASLSGIPTATDADVDNWTFQVEAILHDEPKRLGIFRIPKPYDALRTAAGLGESPLKQQLDHSLNQLEEVIKGLP
jgi:hypothetical protein